MKKLIRNMLNALGILDAQQQKRLAAETLSLRSENQLLRTQVKELQNGCRSILDHAQQMSVYKTHAELMQWDTCYLLAYTALGHNQGRQEAKAANSSEFGNDPKEVTGMKASRASEAIKQGKSPEHLKQRIRRQRPQK